MYAEFNRAALLAIFLILCENPSISVALVVMFDPVTSRELGFHFMI